MNPCDLEFSVDLVGVRPDVIAKLRAEDQLEVVIVPQGAADSVVCQDARGAVAGTLAAFRGLAQLINCLKKGEQYAAIVTGVSKTRCTVHVARITQ